MIQKRITLADVFLTMSEPLKSIFASTAATI
jgi:hypothetical protein